MNTRCWLGTAVCAATLSIASGVWAQEWEPMAQGHRLGGDLDLWPRDAGTIFTLGFVGQIELIEHLMLDIDVPFFAYGNYDRPDRDAATFGNPMAGVHWGGNLSDNFAMYAGGGIAFPTIFNPGPTRSQVAFEASLIRAFHDLHRFWYERLTIRPKGGLEARFVEVLFLRADLGLPLYIPVGGDRGQEVEFGIEQGVEFEYRHRIGVGAGARLQFFILATGERYFGYADQFQAAFEPYFVFEPHGRSGFFARVGPLVALDRPLGFGFDQNRLASIKLSMGGKF